MAVQHRPIVPSSIVRYKVIANLPYYLTSAVIRQLLESTPPPERLVLTVQREVASGWSGAAGDELAGPGGAVLLHGADRGEDPGGAFYPVPKVDSAVVRLDRRPEPAAPGVTSEAFSA